MEKIDNGSKAVKNQGNQQTGSSLSTYFPKWASPETIKGFCSGNLQVEYGSETHKAHASLPESHRAMHIMQYMKTRATWTYVPLDSAEDYIPEQ